MDFIRQQLVLIQDRLRGLSPSQKMLAATLVVIIAMTMLYWGRAASDRDMVALYSTPLDAASMQAATSALSAAGITYDTATGTIRVSADHVVEANGVIASVAATSGANGSDALEATLDKLNPLSTQGEFTTRIGLARNKTLVQMITGWGGVRSAQVQITDAGRGQMTPTPAGAVVTITTKAGGSPRKLANAALAVVLPMVPGLTREGVTVAVDGTPYITAGTDNGGFGNGELIEQRSAYEVACAQEIKSYYNIPGLQVTVTADVNVESKVEKSTTVDPTNKISLPTLETSEKTTTVDGGSASSEPGAVPNTGIDANSGLAASPVSTSKTEKTETHTENAFGRKETETNRPAGETKILSATLRVPHPYFEKIWKRGNKGAEPTDDAVQPLIANLTAKMKQEVMIKWALPEEKVMISDDLGYEDPMMLAAVDGATAAGGSGGTISALAGSHGKEVAIGALALTSLFMVGRMVKKSAPAPVAPLLTLDDMPDVSTKKPRKPNTLGMMDIAGEVAEGGPVLMGQELDEDVLETSQMVEQVSGYVKDNPDTTAQLLKRWMSRE